MISRASPRSRGGLPDGRERFGCLTLQRDGDDDLRLGRLDVVGTDGVVPARGGRGVVNAPAHGTRLPRHELCGEFARVPTQTAFAKICQGEGCLGERPIRRQGLPLGRCGLVREALGLCGGGRARIELGEAGFGGSPPPDAGREFDESRVELIATRDGGVTLGTAAIHGSLQGREIGSALRELGTALGDALFAREQEPPSADGVLDLIDPGGKFGRTRRRARRHRPAQPVPATARARSGEHHSHARFRRGPP